MAEQIVHVKLHDRGIVWSCLAAADISLEPGCEVVVEKGQERDQGAVWGLLGSAESFPSIEGMARVLHRASEEDHQRYRIKAQKEEMTFSMCREAAEARGLPIRLAGVRYAFDETSVIFYYFARQRADTGALTSDMHEKLGAAVEMRQMNPADEWPMKTGPTHSLAMGGAHTLYRPLPAPQGAAASWLAFSTGTGKGRRRPR
jgi:cell fate regulator YaaT (PSP1 superfamily)